MSTETIYSSTECRIMSVNIGRGDANIPFWERWMEPDVIMRLMLPDISYKDCLHVLFFPSERRASTGISLIPAKHLCHIISTSQSFLSNGKESGSSVLISVFYSVSVLYREKLHCFEFCLFFSCIYFFPSGVICPFQLRNTVLRYFSLHAFFWHLLILGVWLITEILVSLFFSLSLSAHINKEALDLAWYMLYPNDKSS